MLFSNNFAWKRKQIIKFYMILLFISIKNTSHIDVPYHLNATCMSINYNIKILTPPRMNERKLLFSFTESIVYNTGKR